VAALGECVFDNRQQRVIALRKKRVAGTDKNFRLIRLRSRLIEAFSQIVKIERDEIDNALAGNPQPLIFFDLERRP
jgi:hypothetical protein